MPYSKPLRPDSYAGHTLSRYSGSEAKDFQRFVILTNFAYYAEKFLELDDSVETKGNWQVVHNRTLECSLINFGMGSPMAGMVMHCISYLDQVDAVIVLGLAGGTGEGIQLGDFVLPSAAIRDEGTSDHYLDPGVPALPSFRVQHLIERAAEELGLSTRSGLCKTTDYRMWEFDTEFADRLRRQRIIAIDMELSTLFSVGYALGKPIGAVMLVSDLALEPSGVKTTTSTRELIREYADQHFTLGITTVKKMREMDFFLQDQMLPCEW